MILVVFTSTALSFISCSLASEKPFETSEKAVNLAKESIIIDGHIDVPYRIYDQWEDVSLGTDSGDFVLFNFVWPATFRRTDVSALRSEANRWN